LAQNTEKVVHALQVLSPEITGGFHDLMSKREFIVRLTPDDTAINLDFNPSGVLTEASSKLEPLTKRPQLVRMEEETFKMKGHIIGTSDLSGVVKGKRAVEVYAANGLLVDENIAAPGTSLMMASPLWKVVGTRKIDLKGRKGKSQNSHKAVEEQDGMAGLPGQSGGHFLGLVRDVHQSHQLTIDVRGGNGGNGQNGGDGHDGNPGENGEKALIEKRNVKTIIEQEDAELSGLRTFFEWTLTGNNGGTVTHYKSGSLGEKGGDAGKGGKGGEGGFAGSVVLKDIDTFKLKNWGASIVLEKGNNGKDGLPGTYGKGGRNGHVYVGSYVEKQFNGWRLAGQMLGGAGAGAGTGAAWGSWGGLFGAAAGAVGGAVVGAVSPLIGSGVDSAFFCDRWIKGPEMLNFKEYADNGIVPSHVSFTGLEPPSPSFVFNLNGVEEKITREFPDV